jgi:hypothetical protein
MPLPSAENVERWAASERCRTALVALAAELTPKGIELLVIKGVYVAFVLADGPWGREMLDADAIVVRGSFSRAVDYVRASPAYQIICDDWSTKTIAHRATRAAIDLHRLPLPPAFGRVSLSALRARARTLPDVFGPHVLVPDPLDAAACAVAHYVKDIIGHRGPGRLVLDLDRMIARTGVAPEPLAARLAEHGLRRVGLVAFTAVAEKDTRWLPWRDACARSRLERRAARAVVSALHRLADDHYDTAFLLVRSIADRTMPDSAIGFALTAARLTRDRLRALVRHVR